MKKKREKSLKLYKKSLLDNRLIAVALRQKAVLYATPFSMYNKYTYNMKHPKSNTKLMVQIKTMLTHGFL